MNTTRRTIIKSSLLTTSSFSLPIGIRTNAADDLYMSSKIDHDSVAKKLRAIALNKASELGSDYADVRFIYKRGMQVRLLNGFTCEESLGVAIRVLVQGYWGFCCTPIWSEESVHKAVQLAYSQARGNAQGPPREIDQSWYTAAGETGEWIMPIKVDPFKKNPYEFEDYIWGLFAFIQNFPKATVSYALGMSFSENNSWFGSTSGILQYQRTYATSGEAGFMLKYGSNPRFDVETLPISGVGYELFTDQDLYTQLRAGFDEALELSTLALEPVDVGRYHILLPGVGAASLLGSTLGAALELDRIVGVEANAGGTSYIQNPAEELGGFKIAVPSFNVDYNRDEAGAIGTRRWDDEGTPCSKGKLVEDGVIKKAFSDKEMKFHVQSLEQVAFGNSIASDFTIAPVIRPGNMTIKGQSLGTAGLRDLIREVDNGIYFRTSSAGLDFQMTSGMIVGDVYGIKRGRLISRILNAGCWFRSTEIWNNIEAIGSSQSQQRTAVTLYKGEPPSISSSSVTSPAILFKNATIIDTTRK